MLLAPCIGSVTGLTPSPNYHPILSAGRCLTHMPVEDPWPLTVQLPPVVCTKQLSLPHSVMEKGSSELNWLLTVLPALSTTFTFQGELARTSSIDLASSDLGVGGRNSTASAGVISTTPEWTAEGLFWEGFSC